MSTQAYSPGLEGVIAGETKLSFVNPERQSLMYCGYDIRELAEHSCFEEVAYLMLHQVMPTQSQLEAFKKTLKDEADLSDDLVAQLKALPKGGIPMDLLRAGAALLALTEKEVTDNSHEANVRKATRLIAKFPALITYSYRLSRGEEIIKPNPSLSHAANFLYMLTGTKPDAETEKLFDVTLICYVDHGFNASTFAARVTTSTLADMHSGIVSAIGTLKGPLHGGANEEAMKVLMEIGSVDKAREYTLNAIAAKKKMMGFGHRAYKSGDPRARLLTELAKPYCERKGEGKWPEMAAIVEDVMLTEKNIHPNVDFPTAYVYYVMGLPMEIYTPIFALARIAGWSAHVIEQHDGNRLIRPKAIYDGPQHLEYVPIAQR